MKLTEKEYLHLYPYLLPEEIKEEFGAFSICPRGIRDIYQRNNLPNVRDAQQKLFISSHDFSKDIDFGAWNDSVLESFTKRKKEKIEEIWTRLKTIDGIYNTKGVR